MRTSIKFFVLVASILLVFSGCKKYEDGPVFSLLTKKARLTGEWSLDSYSVNEADQTSIFLLLAGNNFKLKIAKDDKYSIVGNLAEEGTWKLTEDKNDIVFRPKNYGDPEKIYRILRLKNKELWFKQTQSTGNVVEYHFKQ